MVAVSPVNTAPVDYYALYESLKAGVQPAQVPTIQPTIGGNSDGEFEQVLVPAKGLDQVFEKDVIVNCWNVAMMMMTTVKSLPTAPELARCNPKDEKYVQDRLIEAHLNPVYVY